MKRCNGPPGRNFFLISSDLATTLSMSLSETDWAPARTRPFSNCPSFIYVPVAFRPSFNSTVTRHEILEASQGFLDLLIGSGIARPGETFAAGPKGIAGNYGHVLFLEQTLTEGFIVHARGRHLREGIEGALGFECLQPQPVEAVHHQPPAPIVLGHHGAHVLLAGKQGFEGGVLGDRGCRHHAVLMDADHALDEIGRARCIADAPARHRVVFGEASKQDRAIPRLLTEGGYADVLEVVYQPIIALVRDQDQLKLFCNTRDLHQYFAGGHGAGGIVRIGHEDDLGT